ncbi:MAG: hypothetical protein ABJP45_11400, partial [Cyclobacteriaceae bacterium]
CTIENLSLLDSPFAPDVGAFCKLTLPNPSLEREGKKFWQEFGVSLSNCKRENWGEFTRLSNCTIENLSLLDSPFAPDVGAFCKLTLP